jgi:hypothetical protein
MMSILVVFTPEPQATFAALPLPLLPVEHAARNTAPHAIKAARRLDTCTPPKSATGSGGRLPILQPGCILHTLG